MLLGKLLTPEQRKTMRRVLDSIVIVIGISSITALIAEFGFYLSWNQLQAIDTGVTIVVALFVAQEILRLLLMARPVAYIHERRPEAVVLILIFLQWLFPEAIYSIGLLFIPDLRVEQLALLSLAATQATLVLSVAIRALRYNQLLGAIRMPPGALFMLSFLLLILGGTAMLLLPKASTSSLTVLDALFTATSAVCVTGLSVVDTATAFTPLGKFIVLVLIQIGGLGIMTLTTFFALFFSGGISVRERLLMSSVLSESNIGEVSSILLRITLLTFSIEGIGAIFLYISQGGSFLQFDIYKWYTCVFHSISAFCNAGFSLYTAGLYDEAVRSNYAHHSIIMALIVLGGLGFTVLSELLRSTQLWKPRSYRVQHRMSIFSRLSLMTTVVLLVGGTLLLFFVESQHSFRLMAVSDQLFHSLFLSVTSRTAGYHIAPIEALSIPTALIMVVLMWVGASPGSTGGGIKTTTIALAILNIRRTVFEYKYTEVYYRRIASSDLSKAFAIIILSMLFAGTVSILLVYIEPDKSPVDLLFEVVSAMSTVGLSRNITAFMGDGGKVLLIVTMFIGRVGLLTVLYAFVKPVGNVRYKFPEENIMVG